MSERPTTSRRQRIVKGSLDTAKVVGALGTAVVAAFGWLEARETAKVATNDNAVTEAKVDKAYTTLAEAVKRLAEDNAEQRQVIGDLREAVGELRGALEATRNIRASRAIEDSPALKALTDLEAEPEPEPEPEPAPAMDVGAAGGSRGKRKAKRPKRSPASLFSGQTDVQMVLPESIQVEQKTVDEYVQRKR